MFRAFLVAMQFLTCIPIKFNYSIVQGDMGRSLYFYPLVGLLIGGILFGAAILTQNLGNFMSAALVIALWAFLTGGLHIDGLSDMSDAWVGGFGSKEKTLKIMKDPACGPMGVISIVLLILLKTTTTAALFTHVAVYYILFIPVLSRTLAIVLLIITPYVRDDGIGKNLADEANTYIVIILGVFVAILLIVLTQVLGIVLLTGSAMLLLLWRQLLMKRLGGCTGDTIGALIEVSELVLLLLLVSYVLLL